MSIQELSIPVYHKNGDMMASSCHMYLVGIVLGMPVCGWCNRPCLIRGTPETSTPKEKTDV